MRQVPLPPTYISPSTTTFGLGETGFVKYLFDTMYHYRRPRSPRIRQVRRCKYHSEPCTTTVAEDPCNVNVNDYRREYLYRRVNHYFPRRPRTTTSLYEFDPF